MIAFEMARQLERQGERVELLALIDAYPPRPENPAEQLSSRHMAALFALDLARLSGRDLPLPEEALSALSPEQLLERLGLDLPWTRAALRTFEAMAHAANTYSPGPWSGRATFFLAREEKHSETQRLDGGWSPLATGGVETREVAGNHYSLLRPPQVKELASHLRDCIRQLTPLHEGDDRFVPPTHELTPQETVRQ
jgi:thioesterase domain-containing protein